MSGDRGFGCGDNSCIFGAPGGMATNGGCSCLELTSTRQEWREQCRRLRRGILYLRDRLEHSTPAITPLLCSALYSAIEWMAEDGCDCGGSDDPACALCLCRSAYKELMTEVK